MLVLTRKEGEKLILYREGKAPIEMAIIGIKGKQIRIGIEADKDVKILREELIEKAAAN